ncbi:hypothetical protein EX30DRAFT_355520 [Ascodesmis nigricans]|uniref:Phosphatidate phosphatase APP1 catalytic domain-containing protein n=1 Tax=Ascodesmis nigricans TaxID=341454 RepID=A0A4S2MTL3_9PEZI|nr:hypothetical protein EX30DRAFT_355520 [Ascodesmis nigricans]
MAHALSTLKLPPLLQRILRKLRILPTLPPSPIQPGESVWLYNNIGYRDAATNRWVVQFICAYFYRGTGKDLAKVVANITTMIGLAPGADPTTEQTIANRVQPFLDTILEGKTVQVAFNQAGDGGNENQIFTLGPGGSHGVSVNDVFVAGDWREGNVVRSRAIMPGTGESSGFQSCSLINFETRFADQEGWAVVSDIDDTIKVTEVRDRLSLLRHTFVLPPETVPGMPEAYSRLNSLLSAPPWFYLSASPYNLFPLLSAFVASHYPRGQLLLREMSWQELESFIVTITMGTQQYKENELEVLIKNFPKKKWVFIGDSTQKDPEAYAAVYRRHPTNVRRIWVRLVKGVDVQKEKELNSKERLEKAFKGVPREIWSTFEDPEVLTNEVKVMVAADAGRV